MFCYNGLKKVWGQFKEFLDKRGGNVVDLGVGIIIGTAFSSLVNSFVNDILSPPLGLLFSGSNLANWFIIIRPGQTPGEKYHTPEEAQADGAVTENIGRFINNMIQFVILASALFWIVLGFEVLQKRAQNLRKREMGIAEGEPTEVPCPWCKTEVPKDAIKCKFCCSFLNEKPPVKPTATVPTVDEGQNNPPAISETLIDV